MGRSSRRKKVRRGGETLANLRSHGRPGRQSLSQDEAERHNERLTVSAFPEEVDLARSLIAHLGEIFASGGAYTPAVPDDPITPVLALGARSLNSAWCSHRMILQGYYTQALMLIRHIDEDFATGHAIGRDDDVRKAIWAGKRPKGFSKMLATIEQADVAEAWADVYDINSEISHPRHTAMELQFTDDGDLKLGPFFDEGMARYALACLIISTSHIATLLSNTMDAVRPPLAAPTFQFRDLAIRNRVQEWMNRKGVEAEAIACALGL